MNRRVIALICCLLVLLTLPLPTLALGPVQVRILFVEPTPQNMLNLNAAVSSDGPLDEVAAQIDDRRVALTESCAVECTWTGSIPLQDLAKGNKTVTITAVNSFGQKGEASAEWQNLAKPRITVREPADESVISGAVNLDAEAVGDGTKAGLEVYALLHGKTRVDLLRVDGPIRQTADLSSYTGQTVELHFAARDTNGQYAEQIRTVHVEPAGSLVTADQAPGRIADFDDRRLLLTDRSGTLRVADRSSRAETPVWPAADGRGAVQSQLTPTGVLFLAPASAKGPLGLYHWRQGQPQRVDAPSPADVRLLNVTGAYTLYTTGQEQTVYLLNTATNTSAKINVPAGSKVTGGTVDSQGNGFISTRRGLYSFRPDGISTPVASAQTEGNSVFGPLQEGAALVYNDQANIYFNDGKQTLLSGAFSREPAAALRHYRIQGGWVAFENEDAAGRIQLYLRGQDGQVSQLTQFEGNNIRIDGLAADGTAAFTHEGQAFVQTPGNPQTSPVASGNGTIAIRNGVWYKMLGSSLFRLKPAG